MLQRRGVRPTVVIGLAPPGEPALSHAWLVGERGGFIVGGEEASGYQAVTEFRRP
jgi:hypothetical protein